MTFYLPGCDGVRGRAEGPTMMASILMAAIGAVMGITKCAFCSLLTVACAD